jgi:hypothetical protein
MFVLTPNVVQSPVTVSDVDEHPGHRPRRAGTVEEAHLEVGEVDPIELRIGVVERAAQGDVDRVHRAVPLGGERWGRRLRAPPRSPQW